MKYWKYFLVSLLAISIDQASKLWVNYNMEMGLVGEITVIADWFKLHYLLNPGMAFGVEIDSPYGKFILTFLRIGASIAMIFWIKNLIARQVRKAMIYAVSLILGGAVGNLIDSIFYGVLLDNAPESSPTAWFHGQVIDMLYFPLVEGQVPDWSPIWANEDFIFFRPVFNIADSCIFIGVVMIMLFGTHTQHPAEKPVELKNLESLGENEPENPLESEKNAN